MSVRARTLGLPRHAGGHSAATDIHLREIDDRTGLHELLELCSGLGLRLISVRRLPSISAKHYEDVHGRIELGELAELPPI